MDLGLLARTSKLAELCTRLPQETPFTAALARESGVNAKWLHELVVAGLLRHPMRGVYLATTLQTTLETRLACLRLVVPEDCVVTDRTAAWLWGATTALAPNQHLRVPKISVFSPPGHRLRNGIVSSGERRFRPEHLTELDGLRVTTPLRTACDLGRLLRRDEAFAALDALTALGHFSSDELRSAARCFPGYRGVVQLRTLVPWVDGDAASPGESVLRLRWLDLGLPRPECQLRVANPFGGNWYLDMGLEGIRLAAEYDGEEHHSSPIDRARDAERRACLRDDGGWRIVVARRDNVYGAQDVNGALLLAARAVGLRC